MIFVGDVSIAPGDRFLFKSFPLSFLTTPVCFNLEGPISHNSSPPRDSVCNTSSLLDTLAPFKLGCFGLANNHIMDLSNGLKCTTDFFESQSIPFFGAGASLQDASRHLILDNFILVGFGWSPIGCKLASHHGPGVNPLITSHVISTVQSLILKYPDHHIVPVLHWNYEFELYPQPAHRVLAHKLADLGVRAVIGHHPHIPSHIEFHNSVPIVYSLGNFAFSYGKFFQNQLRFPPPSFYQIAIELSDSSPDLIHYMNFVPPNLVAYHHSEIILESPLYKNSPYHSFSHSEYPFWFKSHRKKSIFLPVYRSDDCTIIIFLKNLFASIRHLLLLFLFHSVFVLSVGVLS